MKLSELLGTRTIDVEISGHTIEVEYRLAERSIVAQRALVEENVAETVVRLVASWTLFEDDGSPVVLTVERLEQIPIPILARVIRSITEDIGLGEASSSSDAG